MTKYVKEISCFSEGIRRKPRQVPSHFDDLVVTRSGSHEVAVDGGLLLRHLIRPFLSNDLRFCGDRVAQGTTSSARPSAASWHGSMPRHDYVHASNRLQAVAIFAHRPSVQKNARNLTADLREIKLLVENDKHRSSRIDKLEDVVMPVGEVTRIADLWNWCVAPGL